MGLPNQLSSAVVSQALQSSRPAHQLGIGWRISRWGVRDNAQPVPDPRFPGGQAGGPKYRQFGQRDDIQGEECFSPEFDRPELRLLSGRRSPGTSGILTAQFLETGIKQVVRRWSRGAGFTAN